MTAALLFRRPRPWLAVPLLLLGSAVASACPFCSSQGQTLSQEVNQASMVLYGTFTNAKPDVNDLGGGTSDFVIESVLKRHEALGNRKVLTLNKYVPADKNTKFLVFLDVFKGKLDPYQGRPVHPDIVKYLPGALALKDKPLGERLTYYFKYLDHPDIEISTDAYKEFAVADYKDYRDMAKRLPADKIAAWLTDPATPAYRYGLYASMLGHCGTDKHAEVLRKLLDDPQKQMSTGIDGMLAGYTMLRPKDGWAHVRGILKDPSREFMLRYAALRAVRFFWDYRPDLVDRKEQVAAVSLLLDQGDIADLAIEDLRKWGRAELTPKVLGLYDLKSHDVPIIRRSILRFALSFPQQPQAAEFVARLRKKDPEMVQDAEELLKLETAPAASQVPAGSASSK